MADIRRPCIWNTTIGIDSESTFGILLRLFKLVPELFTNVWVCVITFAQWRVVNQEPCFTNEVVVVIGERLPEHRFGLLEVRRDPKRERRADSRNHFCNIARQIVQMQRLVRYGHEVIARRSIQIVDVLRLRGKDPKSLG